MPFAVLDVILVGQGCNGSGEAVLRSVDEVAVLLDGDVVEHRVVIGSVLPGIDGDAQGWGDPGQSKAAALRADLCADGLEYEGNAIGALCIGGSEEDIETKVEAIPQADLVYIPH